MLHSVIALLLAIAFLHLSPAVRNDTLRLMLSLSGYGALILGLVYAPWLFKVLITITILVFPSCLQPSTPSHSKCSRLCIARANCRHAHV